MAFSLSSAGREDLFFPFIWGKDEYLHFCFVFPHPFLLSGRNSFLEASTSGRGVVLRPLLLYSVLSQNPAQGPPERSSDSVQGEMTQGRPLGPSEGHLETLKSLNPELMLWILIHFRRLRVFWQPPGGGKYGGTGHCGEGWESAHSWAVLTPAHRGCQTHLLARVSYRPPALQWLRVKLEAHRPWVFCEQLKIQRSNLQMARVYCSWFVSKNKLVTEEKYNHSWGWNQRIISTVL